MNPHLGIDYAVQAACESFLREANQRLLYVLHEMTLNGSEDFKKGWENCCGRLEEEMRAIESTMGTRRPHA